MNSKVMKNIVSFAMASALLCTGATAQAATLGEQSISNVENSASALDFNSCVENIRSIYIDRYPGQAQIVNDIVDEIASSEIFLDCYESDGVSAFQIIEDSLRDVLIPSASTYGYSSGRYYTNYTVPTIEESRSYYCGPAATLQALIGSGKLANTASNKSDAKQDEVAVAENTTSTSGTYISRLTAYMQTYYTSASTTFKTKAFTRYTYDKVIDFLTYSLQNNAAPILLIRDTSVLGYYGGYSISNYVTVKEVNTNNQTITIVDPNHNSKYGGVHTISYDELFKNANSSSDLWISVYTNVADGTYVYG